MATYTTDAWTPLSQIPANVCPKMASEGLELVSDFPCKAEFSDRISVASQIQVHRGNLKSKSHY